MIFIKSIRDEAHSTVALGAVQLSTSDCRRNVTEFMSAFEE
jgi:hypothetical protein